jgi:dihydrofolate reductase
MSLTRIHNLSISLDGFATGEPQSADAPFGHAGERLHEWLFATRFWGAGGTGGVDNAFAEQHSRGIGAEIMGANKFGPPGWQDDRDWKGWWGANPPFHTPTFVLTHRPRPSSVMEGGTVFHFLDATPAAALETAREAAHGQDVRIGGGQPHRRARLPRRRARRPHASRPSPHRARPRRPHLGRPGSPRGRIRSRGSLLAQQRHPPHLHAKGRRVNADPCIDQAEIVIGARTFVSVAFSSCQRLQQE